MALPLRSSSRLTASLPRPLALWRCRAWWCCAVLCAVALLGVSTSPAALAQESPPCEALLEAAEERYVSREFAEAEDLIRACLAQPDLTDDEALQGYRLLALVFLRQDDLPEARQAVVRLLAVSFAYAPDPVQDPPAYVALVTSVKEQLRVDGGPFPASDSALVVPPAPQAELPEPDIQIVQTNPDPPEDGASTEESVVAREGRGITRWLLIGGGVLAAGVAGVLLAGGGSPPASPGGTPLPPPPAFPR